MGYIQLPGAPVRYVTSDPNGVVTAPRGTIAVNTTTRETYQNTDGGTTWVQGIYSQASNTLLGNPKAIMTSGRYYFVPNDGTSTTSATLGNGTLRVYPVWIPNTVTITRMLAGISVVGEAGSKVRLGIYGDDGTFRPGQLVLDAGTIAGDSATDQEITGLSTTIGPGWYWFGGAVQSAPTTQPTVRISIIGGGNMTDVGTSTPAVNTSVAGAQMTGVTGALPSTFVWANFSSSAPRIAVKL